MISFMIGLAIGVAAGAIVVWVMLTPPTEE
jgi:hypothetical protein